MKSLEPLDCAHVEFHLADLVAGRADAELTAAIHAHAADCPTCRQRLADADEMWAELGRWPDEEPSPELAQRFHHWLAAESVDAARPAASQARSFGPSSRWLVAAALLAGVALGRELPGRGRGEIAGLQSQVETLTQQVAIALLAQPTAGERVRGAAFSRDAGRYDRRIVDALLAAVGEDSNSNVRLAAVEALGALLEDAPQGDRADVVQTLVATTSGEPSPVVQIALVDLLATPGAASRRELENLATSGRLDAHALGRLRRHLETHS